MNNSDQKKRGYIYKREDLLTAKVIIVKDEELYRHTRGSAGYRFVKYHKIRDNFHTLQRFERFVRGEFPTCRHVNYYGGVSERLIKQSIIRENYP